MHEVAGLVDGDLPEVVDDELAAVVGTALPGASNMLAKHAFLSVLHPQLHQFDPQRHQPLDPVGTVDDQVEGIELHAKTPFPITGVDGTAMSRGSSMPAAWA